MLVPNATVSTVLVCTQMLQFGGVSLSYMRLQLEEGCTEHSSACCAPPQFAVDSTAGVDNLIMKCKVCTAPCSHSHSVLVAGGGGGGRTSHGHLGLQYMCVLIQ